MKNITNQSVKEDINVICELICRYRDAIWENQEGLQRDKSEIGTLDTYWLGSELGTFRIHRLNNGNYQFGLAKIRNIHELQHALRLCGINKEITI